MSNKNPNLLVLNPYSQGILVFTKPASGDLERVLDSNDAQEIFQAVCRLPKPRLAVHIGRAYDNFLGRLVFHETDFCTIPLGWLSHIPNYQVNARAQFAAHLAQAYLRDPIRLFGAKEPSYGP